MMTLARLKHHCQMLVDSDLGYIHPLISAAELLSIIAELESGHLTEKKEKIKSSQSEKSDKKK
ncbi:hypothetical protein [Aeromonas media]|uniref:hypothetical protein n=1 Tax=Aeromonas media TaxID=651 RepID=UPI003D1C137B